MKPRPGRFVWHDLLTTDRDAAIRFYTDLFGWEQKTWDLGNQGTYWIHTRDGRDAAGTMQMPPDAEAPPNWLGYVLVEDVDATVAKARGLGAMVFVAGMDIPEVGRMGVLADPTGAAFGVFAAPRV